MDRAEAADSLRAVAADFHGRGWCVGTAGSFSIALQRDPLELLITRSGADKGSLRPEDLVVVGVDGQARPVGQPRPSSEALLHATITAVTHSAAVLHTHTVWNTLLGLHHCAEGGFTLSGFEMLKGLDGVDHHEAEVFVPVVDNSQDMNVLAGEVKELLAEWPGANGFVIAGHGLYTWGDTFADARRHVEIFEFLLECTGRRTTFAVAPSLRGGL